MQRGTSPSHKALDVALAIAVAGAVVLLGWTLWYTSRGFDFTDEGYYLLWIDNPGAYAASITQFGFIFHPVYEALQESIVALRAFNVLVTYALGVTFSLLVLTMRGTDTSLRNRRRVGIAALLGLAALAPFSENTTTPNYNTLALQGLIVVGIGVALRELRGTPRPWLCGVLIGVGEWLAFMGKPTTGIAIGCAVTLWLLLTSGDERRLLTVAISVGTASVLGVGTALLIDGSVLQFIDRMRTEAKLQPLFGQGHGHTIGRALRIDPIVITTDGVQRIFMLTLVTAATAIAARRRMRGYLVPVFAASAIALAAALFAGYGKGSERIIDHASGKLYWALVLAGILVLVHGLVLLRERWQWRPAALAVFLAVVPLLLSFGTNNNYWVAAASAAIFWVLAGILLAATVTERAHMSAIALVFGAVTVGITAGQLGAYWKKPYRIPVPLWQLSDTVRVPADGSTLHVDVDTAMYLANLYEDAQDEEFKQGTPFIDLTGRSPGTVYALGGAPVARPWLPGGYPGSNRFVAAYLATAPCADIARAWLLIEPGGRRALHYALMEDHGANVENDFFKIGFANRPGMSSKHAARDQLLLQPSRDKDAATSACIDARAEGESS